MYDQLLLIATITFLVMVTPGPDMVLVLRNTLMQGRQAGLLTSAGILSGNLIHISYCVLGIGLVISQSIVTFSVLKYAGAAYLIYLGIISIQSRNSPLSTGSHTNQKHHRSWLVQGFVNNLLNPKGTLFYLSVFTTVITPHTPVNAMVLLIITMMCISAAFWLVFVLMLERLRVRELIERYQHSVNRLLGTVLILFGVRLAVSDR